VVLQRLLVVDAMLEVGGGSLVHTEGRVIRNVQQDFAQGVRLRELSSWSMNTGIGNMCVNMGE
jgi:hypothetical protein